jgi:hypothetical protein
MVGLAATVYLHLLALFAAMAARFAGSADRSGIRASHAITY